LRANTAIFDRIYDDLKAAQIHAEDKVAMRASASSVAPLPLRTNIVFDNVHYTYPTGKRGALNGLSLSISACSTVGIVGGTGAGKTTLVDILLGLLTPDEGTVRIDDIVLDKSSLRAWQSAIGYVPQQIFLGDESIAGNIAFVVSTGDIDRAAVERAARIAELHDFIVNTLPEGYDTQVGERGVRLSGGQRQRLGIARALYRNPDVLILDEATSALDNVTEQQLMRSINGMAGSKTIIMIAHRLTTVEKCDTIFVLEDGRLGAQGTYETLKATSPTFAAMLTANMIDQPEQGESCSPARTG
jgi:ABC-type multidrug transport system fused ATPase/permease subunit